MIARRPTGRTPSRAALALTPRDRSGPFPVWTPTTPRGGWTPATAWEAAEDYAVEHGGNDAATVRAFSRAAYRELLGAVPGLHRQDVGLRLSGVDVRQEPADDLDDWD